MPELGGSQISALLESVPGIANVLRSPVADAMVNMIRAGAGLGSFAREDAVELVQFAVRRGLISADEGDGLLEEIRAVGGRARGRRSRASRGARVTRPGGKKKTVVRHRSVKARKKKAKTAKRKRKATKRR